MRDREWAVRVRLNWYPQDGVNAECAHGCGAARVGGNTLTLDPAAKKLAKGRVVGLTVCLSGSEECSSPVLMGDVASWAEDAGRLEIVRYYCPVCVGVGKEEVKE